MPRLIISQIPEDFDKHKDILLGPFCLVGHEDEFLDWKSYIIEPDPFKTVAEIRNATEYTAKYANSLIPYMKDELNKLNNSNYSIEFWRILIFPWLLLYVQVLWERYLRVKNIIHKYSDQRIKVQIISDKHKWNFQNTFDYLYNGALNIHYNEWILSQLIKENSPANWSFAYIDKEPVRQALPTQSWKRKFYDKYFIKLRCKDLTGVNPLEAMILSFILSFHKGHKETLNPPKTKHIQKSIDHEVEIHKQLISHIWGELPECFKNINGLNHPKPSPSKGKIRITRSFDLYFNESFKKYLAHCSDGGEKIIPTQHGGYGTALFFTWPAEVEYFHDSFITWGWTKHSDYKCNFIDASSPFLSKFANGHKNKSGNLIFVGTITNIVSYGIEAISQPLQQTNYIKEKISFIKTINRETYDNLLYRPYYRDHGALNEDKLIQNIFPGITLCKGDLHKTILDCKLLVLDHPGTTLNIALAANVPTICYWDEELFPSSTQVKPFFGTFEEVGILFKTGKEAAQKVNEIWNNVDSWWAQKEIQEARKAFCWDYARTNKLWLLEWIRMLLKL